MVAAQAGLEISKAAEWSAGQGLAGLHNFYSMPGSIGGSVWMNARCYGVSVSDLLSEVTLLTPENKITKKQIELSRFDYKKTPFQTTEEIILDARFKLTEADPGELKDSMNEKKNDRTAKGHFDFPSAGSVFKNNREFGSPTGKIIDSLGLRGHQIGGACISPKHANIIINTGDVTAQDVLNLIDFIKEKVYKEFSFALEEEVRFTGKR